MKYIRTAPLFWLLLSTGILFTVAGIAGKDSIYAGQEYNPVREPILSVMLKGLEDEIYPWQLFDKAKQNKQVMTVKNTESAKENVEPAQEAEGVDSAKGEEAFSQGTNGQEKPDNDVIIAKDPAATYAPEPTPVAAAEPTIDPKVLATPTPFARLEPLRESTSEEIRNHISADIYGDAGVVRAKAYEFVPVDITWFDDALFIGDSRTVGLRDYTDLSDHADFYCETSLTVYKVLDKEFKGMGTISQALAEKDYKKIYIMVGINELGTGTTEMYMEKYTEVIDTIHELEPEAMIFIQANMNVSADKSSEDKIFNNSNIGARNNAIATLADNSQIFYIDVNEAVGDEQGALSGEYTYDKIHLLGRYNELWKEFLMTKGVAAAVDNTGDTPEMMP